MDGNRKQQIAQRQNEGTTTKTRERINQQEVLSIRTSQEKMKEHERICALISFRRRGVVAPHDALGQPVPAHERATRSSEPVLALEGSCGIEPSSVGVAEAVGQTADRTYRAVEDDTEVDRTGQVAAT